MNQTITLSLVKSLILESVKNETFFRGNVDRAADPKAVTVAYHEQAGNEAYQQRMLERGLALGLEDLKTYLSDYLSSTGGTSADNNIESSEENDVILIKLCVSDRFNKGYTNSLAKLCSKYIEESMLMDWWKPVNEKQSALYAQFVERDLAAIRRCFNKTAPTAPTVPYPMSLSTTGTAVSITVGTEYTVTYTISEGSIDDIECRTADTTLISTARSEEGFTIRGLRLGHTYIELYSRHNPDLTRRIHVYVTSPS